jgi:4-alpha-glucanotransferase
VATSYEDYRQRQVEASPETVRAALRALDVAADGPEEVAAALADVQARPWRRLVAPTVVASPGAPAAVTLQTPEHAAVRVHLELEDGSRRALAPGAIGEDRVVDGVRRVARPLDLPRDLPPGYHRLHVAADDESAECLVVAAPARCPQLGDLPPLWGWMLQLYALRSAESWGLGELADLRRLAGWSGTAGAGFLLCNPLHAATPVTPIEPSPYFPSSRRFVNPLYLRVEELPEFAHAAPAVRARVQRIAERARGANRRDRLDRDAALQAKLETFELLRGVPVPRTRQQALRAYRDAGGRTLEDFATYCALAERHGGSWRTWPEALRHPDAPAVGEARAELAGRITFHVWLQHACDEQLADVQASATAAGMPLGVLSDLAVGVSPDGADAWSMQDELAGAVTIGAPPDAYNQQGQDWQLPPLRPDRLVETGFAPFRELLAPALAHAGGVRIDHILGLFRLWWIPDGADPADGCYVRYPAGELLGVLALEAARAGGALVVGEDLGTVADEIRAELADRGVFGSRVVYFERTARDHPEPQRRLRSHEYPAGVLASVTTHDLPTVAGWWADEDVRVQSELGLLAADTTPEAERERKATERAEMVALLEEEGLLDAGAADDPVAVREALHVFLARTRAHLVAAQPADAVGDLRQPNQPGTVDAYPNWRLPIAEPTPSGHRPLLLDELLERSELRRLAALLTAGRRVAAAGGATAAASAEAGGATAVNGGRKARRGR